MNEQQRTNASKLLSLVLRHKPEAIGLRLDAEGWADVEELLRCLTTYNAPLASEELQELVQTNSKQRFAFNEDYSRIRANQGHSIAVDLQLAVQEPPEYLYHGTVSEFILAIKNEGLRKMDRQHVHLSTDITTAERVAMRRGKPVILTIQSREMYRNNLSFYLSDNGVWLTDAVPVNYIVF